MIDEIFHEYSQMRRNGLDTREALKALRTYIDSLSREMKEQLATRLRTWEKDFVAQGTTQTQPRKSTGTMKPVQPLPKARPDMPVSQASSSPAAPATSSGKTIVPPAWIECPHCGKKNRSSDVFCYSCGNLIAETVELDTRQFADASDKLFSDEFFGHDSVLVLTVRDTGVLTVRDTGQTFELRPQLRNHELVIGRNTDNSAMRPDVDLEAEGAKQGVSRLHLALWYESRDSAIQAYDLGSANGSYINGQRIHPREIRLLRNQDELRLGRLVLRVRYYHPGEEIPPLLSGS
jgi:hypothetical protein